ncbi:lysylphosphatidylglycerol synthase domain-containing protein [Ramlibacter sp.]|uniref:lysylphosphatidylglycerol synthase domain-containing protein n=1 Tax=Ramlibacter sp. TaxID=1917967 RepID=UPI002D312123|nr:lysylphosphatidylglycerol synthase domain-containing protein [Ramlibacter sp.]HYD76172.1 lysylphosphatidylglycerol synthase domain-containing protein [Ramlibacter sp.]
MSTRSIRTAEFDAPHGVHGPPHRKHPVRNPAREGTRLRQRPWWPHVRRGASLLFFALVAWLLWRYGRNIAWDDVLQSLRELPPPALAAAVLLAAASHLLYACFDLIGRRYTRHTLRTGIVMAVTFISYTFNLCIGSLVGGVGFRYRLYSRLGLKTGVITRIVSMSMLTNWLGYKLLAGFLFLVHPLALPPEWHMGNHGLQWIGAGLVALSLGYLLACWKMGDHVWNWRGHELYLPPWRMAVVQMTISCINWSLMAGIIWVLLQRQLPYTDVLTVLLVGAIAGVVLHVPAGLGVFEAVFIALLGHRIGEGPLLAALLGYRAVYYIGPLVIAALLYLVMEARARRLKRRAHIGRPQRQGASP